MKNEKFIVQMYDYISLKINNYFYYLILMEYCKYHTLLEYIDKNKILDDFFNKRNKDQGSILSNNIVKTNIFNPFPKT